MKALVIDGYNAINKIPSIRPLMDKNLEDARRRITGLARDYQRKRGGIGKVTVVFDGRDEYRAYDAHAGSSQVFSATGKGDAEVIGVVRRLSASYDVEVVSDDNYVRNNARVYNARLLTVAEFTSFLNKKKKNGRMPICRKDIPPAKAKEITEELKKYWRV